MRETLLEVGSTVGLLSSAYRGRKQAKDDLYDKQTTLLTKIYLLLEFNELYKIMRNGVYLKDSSHANVNRPDCFIVNLISIIDIN